MAPRKRKPISTPHDLLSPTVRLEQFRRIRSHLAAYATLRRDAGEHERDLIGIVSSVAFVDSLIRMNSIEPLDTPQTFQPPRPEQPLCPEGSEEWLANIINTLVGDPA